jgi:hypothetical protein
MYFADCIIIYILVSVSVHSIQMYYYLVFMMDKHIYIDNILKYKNISY